MDMVNFVEIRKTPKPGFQKRILIRHSTGYSPLLGDPLGITRVVHTTKSFFN
jgi:hypothetical protein